MNSNWLTATAGLLVVALAGCQSLHQNNRDENPHVSHVELPSADIPDRTSKLLPEVHPVRQVGLQQVESASPDLLLEESPEYFVDEAVSYSEVGLIQEQNDELTSLAQIEQMAIETNPAVAEVQAEIESLRGKLTQAGLSPNPTVGIIGDDINEGGGGGRYGVYFGREIVKGNKLGLSQSVISAEIQMAEQRLAVIQQRVLTDVRQRYYDVLVAQEKVSTAEELVEISKNAVSVSKQLVEAKEAAQTSVLQSELELQNALVVNRQAENQRIGARRKLAALLGKFDLSPEFVDGKVREIMALEEFEQYYDQLVNSSPEIAALFADVEQKRRQLARECVEPIPNVTWQTTLQFGTFTNDVVAGFQIGMPLPKRNRNQGAIHQAKHEIVAAERRAEKKALDLRQRLASAYESYLDAKLQVDAFESEIMPNSKKTLELVSRGYREGEIDFLQLLTAQRTYFQINLTYLQQLQQVWRQNHEIRGMLLTGSLE